ncbi:MAG: tetratricopeptide repeat protein [Sandaracinaceae bacterium]|nr:tetratricopeptide repeat protein [Sandaracinaceae bacterium]
MRVQASWAIGWFLTWGMVGCGASPAREPLEGEGMGSSGGEAAPLSMEGEAVAGGEPSPSGGSTGSADSVALQGSQPPLASQAPPSSSPQSSSPQFKQVNPREAGEPLPQRRPMSSSAKEAYERGIRALQAGNYSSAKQELQAALSADPNAYLAMYALGVLADRSGQVEEAINWYRQALRAQPDDEKSVEGIVRIYVRQGRSSDAVAFVQPLAQRWVQNLALQAVYGLALLAANRPQDAIAVARAALRRDERHIPSMLIMVKANLQLGRQELARSILEQILAIEDRNAEAHYLQGRFFENDNQVISALNEYRKAVELDPEHADGHARLGVLLLQSGNYSEASKHLEQASRLAPEQLAVRLALSDAYRGLKEWSKSRAELEKILSRNPSMVEAYYSFGLLLWEQANTLSGQEQLDMLVQAQQQLVQFRTLMGPRLTRDDPCNRYIEDINRQIERVRRSIERERARKEREAARAARQNEGQSGGENAGAPSSN